MNTLTYDIEAFDPSGRIEFSHEIVAYPPTGNTPLRLIRNQAKRLSNEWIAIRLWLDNSSYEIYQDNRFVGKYKIKRPLPKEGPQDDPRLLLKSTPMPSYVVDQADGHFWVRHIAQPGPSFRADTLKDAQKEADRFNELSAGPLKVRDLDWHRLNWTMTLKGEPEPDNIEKWDYWHGDQVLDLDPKIELKDGIYLVEQEYVGPCVIHPAAFIKDGKFEVIPTMNALLKGQQFVHGEPFDHIYIEAIKWDPKRELFTTSFGS